MQTSSTPVTRIVTLRRLIDTRKAARVGGPREAITRALHGECAQATADSFLLYTKLKDQDRWLADNPANLSHRLRENTYLRNLEDYGALEDIIGEAHAAMGMDDERSRSWRSGGEAFAGWRANWVAVTFGEVAA